MGNKSTLDGRTELILTPMELLDRLSKLVASTSVHKHRYCGVLAPNAKLRGAGDLWAEMDQTALSGNGFWD